MDILNIPKHYEGRKAIVVEHRYIENIEDDTPPQIHYFSCIPIQDYFLAFNKCNTIEEAVREIEKFIRDGILIINNDHRVEFAKILESHPVTNYVDRLTENNYVYMLENNEPESNTYTPPRVQDKCPSCSKYIGEYGVCKLIMCPIKDIKACTDADPRRR